MRFSFGPILVSLLLLAGCASTGGQLRPVPIAGGKVVGIRFGPQGPLPGEANGYLVQLAGLVPSGNAGDCVYQFSFFAPPSTTLKRVVVDDISDEQGSELIVDDKPWLDANRWHWETKPLGAKDPLLRWVYTVTPSVRVYRFTITDTAGKETVLYQLSPYPQFIKAAIRARWGEKY